MVVRAYQVTFGRLLMPRCRFVPSCSEYAVEALRANGLVIGVAQTAWRLLRCAPWTDGGFDPVKELNHPVRRVLRARAHV
ncbi:MAG: membrane protein insertion efficiency factor YidD [Actinomycetota bacterium]